MADNNKKTDAEHRQTKAKVKMCAVCALRAVPHSGAFIMMVLMVSIGLKMVNADDKDPF